VSIEDLAQKLRPAFVLNNWTWYNFDLPPTEQDIVKFVQELCGVLDSKPDVATIESGRIGVRREEDGAKTVYLTYGVLD